MPLGKPRREPGIPSDVRRLFARLRDPPTDDLLDFGRFDARALDYFRLVVARISARCSRASLPVVLPNRSTDSFDGHGFRRRLLLCTA